MTTTRPTRTRASNVAEGGLRYGPAIRLLRLAWSLRASTVGLTIDDMTRQLGDPTAASRRTAERAKRAIERAFPQLECANPDGPGPRRWRLPAMALEGLVGFGADDLAALASAAEACERQGLDTQAGTLRDFVARLRALIGPRAAGAAVDLAALTEAEGIAHRPGPRAPVDPAVLAALRHAIKAMKQVTLVYRGRGSGARSRQRVSPLGLLYGARAYLIAYNHNPDAEAIRSFALANVEAVEPLDAPVHRPEGFVDLRAHTAHWFGVFDETPSDIVLRFDRDAATVAREFVFHPSQTLHELARGRLEIRFRAGGLKELAWHLVSWGDGVEVVAPAKLRRLWQAPATRRVLRRLRFDAPL